MDKKTFFLPLPKGSFINDIMCRKGRKGNNVLFTIIIAVLTRPTVVFTGTTVLFTINIEVFTRTTLTVTRPM